MNYFDAAIFIDRPLKSPLLLAIFGYGDLKMPPYKKSIYKDGHLILDRLYKSMFNRDERLGLSASLND